MSTVFFRSDGRSSNKIEQKCHYARAIDVVPAERNDHRDTTRDSDKPKLQASNGSDIHKAAREYLRILRSLNPNYDVKATMSVVVMKRPN